MIRHFIASAGARLLFLPISGAASLATAWIISHSLGAKEYGVFALVVSLPLLVPFADLGLGAAITNAASALPEARQVYRSTVRKARLLLICVAVILTAIDLVVAFTVSWPTVLGISASGGTNFGVTLALLLFALSVPGSLGARALIGRRRNALVSGVQSSIALVTVSGVGIAALLGGPIGTYIPSATLGLAVTTWTLHFVALRDPILRQAMSVGDGAALRVQLLSTAGPMLVLSILLPLTYQSERLIVSTVGGEHQLAIYSATLLLFLPALSVIQVATRSLWGEFGHMRAAGVGLRKPWLRSLALSASLGGIAASALLLIGAPLSEWVVDHQVSVSMTFVAVLSASLIVNALHLPSGMLLTDARGLRFQAICAVASAAIAIPTSVILTSSFGAIGAPIATLTALTFAQFVPCFIMALRETSSRRTYVESSSVHDGGCVEETVLAS